MTTLSDDSTRNASDGSRPLVKLENVDVALAGNRVLHDLNWELHAGDHWAIVGANGSGKTSFLRLIAGNLWPAPNSGTRRYDFNGEFRSTRYRRWTKSLWSAMNCRIVTHGWAGTSTQSTWCYRDSIGLTYRDMRRTPRIEFAHAAYCENSNFCTWRIDHFSNCRAVSSDACSSRAAWRSSPSF